MLSHVKLHPKMMSLEAPSPASWSCAANCAERPAKTVTSNGAAGDPSAKDLGCDP